MGVLSHPILGRRKLRLREGMWLAAVDRSAKWMLDEVLRALDEARIGAMQRRRGAPWGGARLTWMYGWGFLVEVPLYPVPWRGRCCWGVGGGGSQERGGSDRLGISEKASRGERCALILRRYSLQSWEKGKKGGIGRATQPAGLCSQLREAV